MVESAAGMGKGLSTRGVGRRIAFYRRNRRGGLLSQHRLAERVGVSLSTLRKVERGERSVNLRFLDAIAHELRVSVHDLVCGSPHADPLEPALAPFARLIRQYELSPGEAEGLVRFIAGLWEEIEARSLRTPSRTL